jgi:ATP-binding cassette, subfamily B, bacterial PglK
MFQNLKSALVLIARDGSGRWLVLVCVAAAASIFEMVGAFLVFVLLGLVADPSAEIGLPLLGDIRGWFPGVADEQFLLWFAGALAVFFALRVLVQIALQYVKQRMAHGTSSRLSSHLVEGYLRLPYALHLRRNSSELVRNAYQTVEQLAGGAFLPAIQVLGEGIVVVGLLAVMVLIAPGATGAAVVVVGGAALILLRVVQPHLQRLGGRAQDMRQRTLSTLQQSLYGVRDIKVLGAESFFGSAYARDRSRYARTMYINGTLSETPRHIIEFSLMGFILVLFGVATVTGSDPEQLLATLGLFAYVGLRVMPSLQKIVGGLNSIRFAGPAIEHVSDDLDLIEKSATRDSGAALTFERELVLDRVSFYYDETDTAAIIDGSLRVTPGEVIGICGPTGGGKTTLTDLIVGMLTPTSGRVSIDGRDIHEGLSSWLAKLGVVPQMVFLVDDTLRANIAMGVDHEDIDDEALADAIRLAQLTDFVASLPMGLDTVVGERGVRVSGGQRQRVAIARALYSRPQVIVFDEGTSALDNATEASLISALDRLRGRHTIFLVAHRLSSVRNCDRIIFLERGRISDVGSYDELLSRSDGFRSLAAQGG